MSYKAERRKEERTCCRLSEYVSEFLLPLFFSLQIGHEAMIDTTLILFCLFSIKVHLKKVVMVHMTHKGY